jgi:isopentenyl-diphosphate delta-isomerase
VTDPVNERKLSHIRVLQEDAASDRQRSYFDRVRLRHRALPELALDAVDTATVFLGKRLSFPLLISCMTGGDHEVTRRVNRNLAAAAERAGIAMGVGSQRVMFRHPRARDSFAVRAHAPTALLFANLGAVQLNDGFTPAMCREALDVVGADGLYFHLNPLQEAVQPRGDTNFSGLARRIGEVARALDRPVLVKEVGAGIGLADAALLLEQGVRHIDVAGAGGTSWSRIEALRQPPGEAQALGLLFQDWGIPTPQALADLRPLRGRVTLVASGGLRSGLDMAKAMVLGASLCGMALPFLAPAMESEEAVLALIERLRLEFRTAMFLLGAGRVAQLEGNEGLLAAALPSEWRE